MKKSPGVVSTQSVADLIVEINAALGEGRKIPDEKDKIEQLWFLLDGNESMKKFVSEDLDEAIIISKFLSPENKAKIEFGDYMKKFIKENSTEACTIEITGMPFIDVTMDRSLIYSQLGSLAIALLFVIIIVGAILRSFAAGIYAAIPIVSAIIILFGVMGYTGIPLNIATVLVASIAMGIGIDYSIHVITHFNDSLKKGATIRQALNDTISHQREGNYNQCHLSFGRISCSALLRDGSFAVFWIIDLSEYGWFRSERFNLFTGNPYLCTQRKGMGRVIPVKPFKKEYNR